MQTSTRTPERRGVTDTVCKNQGNDSSPIIASERVL